jgi:CheY-like chemotaxis protein
MATLLIIDDELDICDILEDVFKTEKGFSVFKTDNGPEGVALVKKEHPDVIILDLKLQVNMDGVAVLREIRKFQPRARVVVITGYVEEAMEREIRELGVDAYLEKPFNPPQIIEAVQDALDAKLREEKDG